MTHGNWGTWSAYSTCSASCGAGSQRRSRKCNNPAPSNGGRYCSGLGNQYKKCNTRSCSARRRGGEYMRLGKVPKISVGKLPKMRLREFPIMRFGGFPNSETKMFEEFFEERFENFHMHKRAENQTKKRAGEVPRLIRFLKSRLCWIPSMIQF